TVAVGPGEIGIGSEVQLSEPRPNPFSTDVRAELHLDHTQEVVGAVYDTRGRRVRMLFDRRLEPGVAPVEGDGRDDRGQQVRAGVYSLAVDCDHGRVAKKVVELH